MAVFTERIALLIDAKTGGAVQPLGQLETQAKKTDSAFDKMAKSVGLSGSTIKAGLVAGATALIGTGLVAYLQSSVSAYTEAATAANQLSSATNATVESASRFNALAGSYGLGMMDLTEIFSDFQQSATASKDELQKLGVQLTLNEDGTTDWIATAVDFLETMQGIPDATERNRLMFKYFGEEGAKQLMSLVNSGRSVKDALAAIETARIFGTDDIRAAQAYNQAMQDMQGSMEALQFAIGRALVPILVVAAEALTTVVNVIGGVPVEVYALVGAVYVLNAALTSGLAVGIGRAIAGLVTMVTTMGLASAATFTFSAAWEAMTAFLVANPIGLALAALAAGIALAMKANSDFNATVDTQVAKLGDLEKQGMSTADAIEQLASEAENTDSVLGGMAASFKGSNMLEKLGSVFTGVAGYARLFFDSVEEGGDSLAAYEEEIARVVEEQGAMAGVTADAAAKQQTLTDAVAQYLATAQPTAEMQQAIADTAVAASEATLAQKEAANLAEAAAGTYAASIQGVVEWQGKLAGLGPSIEESLSGVQAAYKTAADTLDNDQTWGDEALIESGKARQAVWDYVAALADSGLTSKEITALLIELKSKPGASKALKSDVDAAIAALEGTTNEIPINLRAKLDPGSAATAKAEASAAVGDTEAKVTLNVTNAPAAKAQLDGVVGDREAKLNAVVHNEQNSRNVLDGLVGDREAKINAVVYNEQNTRNVLNGLDNDRHVYYYLHVVGADSARATLNSVKPSAMGAYLGPAVGATATAGPVQHVSNTYTVSVSGAGSPATTAREIDRYLRRAGDRTRVSVTE